MRILYAMCVFAACAASAQAETARELYIAGRFSEAEHAAIALDSAYGDALAARADLAAEMMRGEPCMSCLEHAEELARRAVDADPKLPEGQIELVVALGYESRLMGPIKAHFKGMAKEAKLHIDAALADDPGNAYAWCTLGSWNIEITRHAGPALAHWLYNASISEGLAAYGKALAVAPGNVVVHYQYALSLSGYSRKAYLETIENSLSHAIDDVPQSAYERFAQKNARELLAALRSGDMNAFDELVHRDQGYP